MATPSPEILSGTISSPTSIEKGLGILTPFSINLTMLCDRLTFSFTTDVQLGHFFLECVSVDSKVIGCSTLDITIPLKGNFEKTSFNHDQNFFMQSAFPFFTVTDLTEDCRNVFKFFFHSLFNKRIWLCLNILIHSYRFCFLAFHNNDASFLPCFCREESLMISNLACDFLQDQKIYEVNSFVIMIPASTAAVNQVIMISDIFFAGCSICFLTSSSTFSLSMRPTRSL